MKKYFSITKFLVAVFAIFTIAGCVHDDEYDDPNLDGYQCGELTATTTITDVKAKYVSNTTYVFPDDSQEILEGYVSSSDETGNIYKYIYIQDSPDNPTAGFTISVNSLSNYTKYPQGSKIYIKLAGLAVGVYGNLVQLGAMVNGSFDRIPEKKVASSILRSCDEPVKIVPKVMTLAQMVTANDKFLGCLIQVNDAEFTNSALCSVFAPPTVTVDRPIADPSTSTTRVVRNSGYATFADNMLPAGKGKFVGIYSKFNTTYQMYIVRDTDLEMNTFPRKDGLTANPCNFDSTGLTLKTIAEVKQLYTSGNWTQITGDFYIKAQVTANDATGNLYKYIYVEDSSAGLRVNINKTNLFQSSRYRVGKDIYIKLKNMYLANVNGEIQLGGLYSNNTLFGSIEEADMYKYFFDANQPIRTVTATERTIPQLTSADIGRWVKIKDLQVADTDLYKPYASGGTTNRTLVDCSGNSVILRTSSFASFANSDMDLGKGDLYAIVSYYAPQNVYQLWIPYQVNADFDNPRCDGTLPPKLNAIFSDTFNSLTNWTAVSVSGAQTWGVSNQGTGSNYYAVMNGYSGGAVVNEDWLISKEFDLSGYTNAIFSFDSDVRYSGNALKVYITTNYTNDPTTTTWTEIPATVDTNAGAFGFASSGNIPLTSYLGNKVRIAFKYTSTSSAAATWELDNFNLKGAK